jgi:hypothetical protein
VTGSHFGPFFFIKKSTPNFLCHGGAGGVGQIHSNLDAIERQVKKGGLREGPGRVGGVSATGAIGSDPIADLWTGAIVVVYPYSRTSDHVARRLFNENVRPLAILVEVCLGLAKKLSDRLARGRVMSPRHPLMKFLKTRRRRLAQGVTHLETISAQLDVAGIELLGEESHRASMERRISVVRLTQRWAQMRDSTMSETDPRSAAVRIACQRVPDARGAILAGSALGPERTFTSDLDVVVFVASGEPSFRETVFELGWLAELFVLSPDSYDYFCRVEIAQRRSPLVHMCANGVVLFSRDGVAETRQGQAKSLWADGPPPLQPGELDERRYRLSDLLDDFEGTHDDAELAFIVASLIQETAELDLSARGQWLGTAKWLARQLSHHDPDLATRLSDAAALALGKGERRALSSAVTDVLNRVGGPLSIGYRQDSRRRVI